MAENTGSGSLASFRNLHFHPHQALDAAFLPGLPSPNSRADNLREGYHDEKGARGSPTSRWPSPTEVALRHVWENGGTTWPTRDRSPKRLSRRCDGFLGVDLSAAHGATAHECADSQSARRAFASRSKEETRLASQTSLIRYPPMLCPTREQDKAERTFSQDRHSVGRCEGVEQGWREKPQGTAL